MDKFEKLVSKLEQIGYSVKVEERDTYKSAIIESNNIVAAFCSFHEPINCSPYLNGKIAADNKECFDKWSKCPLNLPLPNTEQEMNYLIKQLEFWGSESGFNLSNDYEYDYWVMEYPIE